VNQSRASVPVKDSIRHQRFFRMKVFVEMSSNDNIWSRHTACTQTTHRDTNKSRISGHVSSKELEK